MLPSIVNAINSALDSLNTRRSLLVIGVLGILIFSSGLFNEFVSDDLALIVTNTSVHSLENVKQLITGGSFYNGDYHQLAGIYYRPMLNLLFALIYSAFGQNSFFFHLVPVAIHIINACLVFLVFKQFFEKKMSFLASLIFLTHPINSEVALYISATQDGLYFLFGMLGIYILCTTQSLRGVAIASVCLFFSLLSKETGILFIIAASLYIFLYHRKQSYVSLGLFSAVTSLYAVLRFNALGIQEAPTSTQIGVLPLLHRALNMPDILYFYLRTFIFPVDLASSHRWVHLNIDFWGFYLPLIADLLFVVGVISIAYILWIKYLSYLFRCYVFFGAWSLYGDCDAFANHSLGFYRG